MSSIMEKLHAHNVKIVIDTENQLEISLSIKFKKYLIYDFPVLPNEYRCVPGGNINIDWCINLRLGMLHFTQNFHIPFNVTEPSVTIWHIIPIIIFQSIVLSNQPTEIPTAANFSSNIYDVTWCLNTLPVARSATNIISHLQMGSWLALACSVSSAPEVFNHIIIKSDWLYE